MGAPSLSEPANHQPDLASPREPIPGQLEPTAPPTHDSPQTPTPTADPNHADHSPGAMALNALRSAIRTYVVLPDEHSLDAVTLWTAATHLQPQFQHAPRLAITGPQKRCGKSRLLDVVEATCHRPIMTVNASVAAVYRSIGENPPTLLVDEADTIFNPKAAGDAEALRGILNGGHQRKRDTLRINGKSMEVETYKTFAMAALAGIGDLPDTLMDRSVVVRMRRRTATEYAAPFRTRDADALQPLRERLAAWAATVAEQAAVMDPAMPVQDRAADTWEPLVIVADLAGGPWPDLARAACRAITARESDRPGLDDYPLQLLADIHAAYAAVGNPEVLPIKQLILLLCSDEESPWPSYQNRGLTPRYLQMLLRDFDISSRNYRFPAQPQAKGFARAQFLDAWTRYCPTLLKDEATTTPATPGTTPAQQPAPTTPRAAELPSPPPADPAKEHSPRGSVALLRSPAAGPDRRPANPRPADPAPYRPPTPGTAPRPGR